MRISDLLATKGAFVATVGPDMTVAGVIDELSTHNVGALVVSNDGTDIAGILSERDVVRALHKLGPAALEVAVRMIMSEQVRTCAPGDEVESLASTMTEHRIRHVPVAEHGRLIGIVSIGDVVKTRIDELEHDRDALVNYISAR